MEQHINIYKSQNIYVLEKIKLIKYQNEIVTSISYLLNFIFFGGKTVYTCITNTWRNK